MFRVLVNQAEVYPIESGADAERLCSALAGQPVFTAHAVGPAGEHGPTLDVIVESGRGVVDFLDIGRGLKLASRNPACTQRDVVLLRNDSFPELQLEQIEVERRDLISPEWAVAILRHFLTTGEPVDLVPWPPDNWGETPTPARTETGPREEIPF